MRFKRKAGGTNYAPSKLSGDRVSDFEVIHHGLTSMEKLHHKSYDYIIMLQPTSLCALVLT